MSLKSFSSHCKLASGNIAANLPSTNAVTAVGFLVSTGGNMPRWKLALPAGRGWARAVIFLRLTVARASGCKPREDHWAGPPIKDLRKFAASPNLRGTTQE